MFCSKIKAIWIPILLIVIIGTISIGYTSCNNPKTLVKGATKLVLENVLSEKVKVQFPDSTGGKPLITEYIPPESPIIITVDRGVSEEEYNEIVAQLESLLAVTSDTLIQEQGRNLLWRLDRTWANSYIRLNYEYKTSGFCFAPNVCGGLDVLAEDDPIGLGVGARIFYVKRFGFGINGMLNITDMKINRGSVNLFGDYRLPFARNVAPGVFGGYDTESNFSGGILMNFYVN